MFVSQVDLAVNGRAVRSFNSYGSVLGALVDLTFHNFRFPFTLQRQEAHKGFNLFFHNYSTFLGKPGIYLEDLFVKPEYRGKGFGKVMLTYLARLTRNRNCGRLEWSVLDWNEPALKFYESIGSRKMDEWTTQRLDGDALDKLAEQF